MFRVSITYTHNWSLQPFSQDCYLASYTTYVVYFDFIHEWRDLQFEVYSERQIFEKCQFYLPLMVLFFYQKMCILFQKMQFCVCFLKMFRLLKGWYVLFYIYPMVEESKSDFFQLILVYGKLLEIWAKITKFLQKNHTLFTNPYFPWLWKPYTKPTL